MDRSTEVEEDVFLWSLKGWDGDFSAASRTIRGKKMRSDG